MSIILVSHADRVNKFDPLSKESRSVVRESGAGSAGILPAAYVARNVEAGKMPALPAFRCLLRGFNAAFGRWLTYDTGGNL